ncbi:MAG: HAMP domain-containing sensor histidine kinase [Planctomycetota bacterium]
MPTRLLLALIVILVTPLGLIGWLSLRSVGQREQLVREQQTLLAERELNDIDDAIQLWLGQVTASLGRVVDNVSMEQPETFQLLTRSRRSDPLVRDWVAINSQGDLIYPTAPALSDRRRVAHHESLIEMAESRPDALRLLPSEPTPSAESGSAKVPMAQSISSSLKSRVVPRSSSATPLATTQATPMQQTWFRDQGLQIVLWWPTSSGGSLGVLLERSAWLARLMDRLPDVPSRQQSVLNTISVRDSENKSVFGWSVRGRLSPSMDAAMPLVSLRLKPPFSAWHLSANAIDIPSNLAATLAVIAPLATIGLVLLALSVYVATSLRRQMRLAQSRVTFAGQVSHELRTPLTNIRLYSELAHQDLEQLETLDQCERLRKRLRVIDQESERLSRLVSGVLEVIRDQSRPRPPRKTEEDIGPLVSRIVVGFREVLEEKQIDLRTRLEAEGIGHVDVELLEVILGNLISNLIKYAAVGRLCLIESSMRDQRLVVSVEDAGPGMTAKQAQRVFKPFIRLNDSIEAPSGTGIGLTIAQRAAKRHGGDVRWVKVPRGTRFEVSLDVGPLGRPGQEGN